MRTGKPMTNAISFSPDLTTKFICTSRVPLCDRRGQVIEWRPSTGTSPTPRRSRSGTAAFSDVAAFINAHYAEPISVDDLVRLTRCSGSQFRRGFKKFFKMTPVDYILLTRVNAARELLDHTTRLISDIAQEVGFCDHSPFHPDLQAVSGHSPRTSTA
jgi:transcriptional regulator GlxA family with amidase domain